MSRNTALIAAALLLSQAAIAAQPIYQHSFDQADGWPDSESTAISARCTRWLAAST